MHILLVSACEKRAIKKTRSVLDSYAIRTSDTSWITPITLEGLRELRSTMKRVATRQTAVACYANDGRSQMRLLWVVGAKTKFGRNGQYPSGTIAKKPSPTPTWVKIACLAATTSGYAHDIGKASVGFQQKLKKTERIADWMRHERVSVNVMRELRLGKSFGESWEKAFNQSEDFDGCVINSTPKLIDAIVATHHRLLPDSKINKDSPPPGPAEKQFAGNDGDMDRSVKNWIDSEARLIQLAGGLTPTAMRGLFIVSRAAMIFADQLVSGRMYPGDSSGHKLLANSQEKQPLEWHLKEVGNLAGETVYNMTHMKLPTLSEEAVDHILSPSTVERFLWQNSGVDAISQVRENSSSPMLIFNMAGTGTGKTRANAKFACASANQGEVRYATALNLRSLTLQTGAAYREQLNIGEDECSVVIGDSVVQELFEKSRQETKTEPADTDTDENGKADDQEFYSTEIDFAPPLWLEEWLKKHPGINGIIGAPVLVSTIDYLIAAGDPGCQGHHVSALLRTLSSDLILDEIDGYDSGALVAVLRLINMAAFFGRNVICASATLSFPVANSVHEAYRAGIAMRAELMSEPNKFHTFLISDSVAPNLVGGAFNSEYRDYIKSMFIDGLPVYRKAYILDVAGTEFKNWIESIITSIKDLHEKNSWEFAESGKRVSFGLVRVANIKVAIRVARALAETMFDARVACYHSNLFMMHRHLLERRLDMLLNRINGSGHIENDHEIAAIVNQSESKNVLFIVVATPVEEIGRDHDFDLGVIEPSSTQAIVQPAGRVNRHRLEIVENENIAILRGNYKVYVDGKKSHELVFTKPGLETSDPPYPHDLRKLMPASPFAVDASLRFDGCKFAELDDKSLSIKLNDATDYFSESGKYFMYRHYEDNRLRVDNNSSVWANIDGVFKLRKLSKDRYGKKRYEFVPYGVCVNQSGAKLPNAWLSWTISELRDKCFELGIPEERGMSVSIAYSKEVPEINFDEHYGFSIQD